MTTESENVVRGLGVLLALDSYQGMSDEEIDTIITYKENTAYAQGNRDAVNSQAMINLLDAKRQRDAMFGRIQNMIEYSKGGSQNE